MGKATTDVDEVLANFRQCRSRGHRWTLVSKDWSRKKKSGKIWIVTETNEEEICDVCKSMRTRTYAVGHGRMDLIDSKLTYPAGYLLKGRRLSAAEALYLAAAYDYPDLRLQQLK